MVLQRVYSSSTWLSGVKFLITQNCPKTYPFWFQVVSLHRVCANSGLFLISLVGLGQFACSLWSTAFDTVDHGILLECLEKLIRIMDWPLQWLCSLLTAPSRWCLVLPIQPGPQWTTGFHPMLYILYTADINHGLSSLRFSAHQYADNTQAKLKTQSP